MTRAQGPEPYCRNGQLRKDKHFMKFLLGLVFIAFVLTGCSSPSIALTPEEGDIPLCASGHSPVPVSELNTDKKVSCKLSDVDLLFPDGTHLNIDPGAYSGSRTETPDTGQRGYTFYSVGIYGFAVGSSKSGCRAVKEWGSTTARAKAREAFGKSWACVQ